MADEVKMPVRLETLNIGKQARIMLNAHAGRIGKIVDFKDGAYQVEVSTDNTGATITVSMPPNHVRVLDDSHIASLTSVGVKEELAKETPELTETEALRRQVAALTADKLTLQAKIVAAEQRFEATRDQNVALTKELATVKNLATEAQQTAEQLQRDMKDDDEALFAIEKERDELKKELELVRHTELDAIKQVEQQRDAAKAEVAKLTHDLEVSREQVAVFAKRLKAQKRGQVEITTVTHEVWEPTAAEDAELAKYLNEGWNVMNISVAPSSDTLWRIVTLSRPIRTTPQSPKREAIVEQPAPVKTVVTDTMIFPPAPTPAGIPVTLNEKPVTYQEGVKLMVQGVITPEELSELGNRQAINKGLEDFNQRQRSRQQYQPHPHETALPVFRPRPINLMK